MQSARMRLVLLWLSQVTRVLADWVLRITVFQAVLAAGNGTNGSAWHLVTAVFIAPFILLAPFHGCISNGLPRRWVLVGACLHCALAVLVFRPGSSPENWRWLAALGLMALGSALYSSSRYAMLPAIAEDAQLPLTRVNGIIELGGVSAIPGGIAIGLHLAGEVQVCLPLAATVVLLLNLFAMTTALPCRFPSDTRRPERPFQAVAGFFLDVRRIHADRSARYSLVGLGAFQGAVTAGSGAVFTLAIAQGATGEGGAFLSILLLTVGVALGCVLAALQSNTRRSLGLVPLGLTGLALAQAWAALAGKEGVAPALPSLLLGLMGGLINVPLRSCYQATVPADARGNAMSVMNAVIYLMTALIALGIVGLVQVGFLADIQTQLGFIALAVALGALLAWKVFLTETCELLADWLLLPLHRLRLHGPGVGKIPVRGPLLLVANHTTWFDPFWLTRLAPRHVRPLMTSRFYDLPVLRWLMKYVVGAIRVPLQRFRHEAPELQEVIAELKRGGCVMIFPEGRMRRTEECILRQFGQGIWHILKELPDTPVVVFWIEGGWGSYTSYKDGPPRENKKMDFRRPIDIAIEEPQVLPPEVLADQRLTRRYLMRACLEARRHLGLAVPADLSDAAQDDSEAI